MTKAMILAAATLACGAAAPLAAQYHLQPYGQTQAVDQSIDGLIVHLDSLNDRQSIRQCVYAALNEAETKYRARHARNTCSPGDAVQVKRITKIERRLDGTRVLGQLDAGMIRGYYEGDVNFRCDVDTNGYVSFVKLDRNYYFAGSNPEGE
ncbi:MAG TPA: hypothetical protein VFH89_02090 [Sphingomicrobium sp.]|nr:hypothetical protein [Sphingomicrobium sp.]